MKSLGDYIKQGDIVLIGQSLYIYKRKHTRIEGVCFIQPILSRFSEGERSIFEHLLEKYEGDGNETR